MADYKLGFFGEEIDIKLQQIEELRGGITQLQQNNETITAAIERINAAIEALQNASTGAVRHVQRGTLKGVPDTYSYEISLSGFTNVDKMIVLFDGALFRYNGVSTEFMPIVQSITTDKLTAKIHRFETDSYATTCSYQVIEFY